MNDQDLYSKYIRTAGGEALASRLDAFAVHVIRNAAPTSVHQFSRRFVQFTYNKSPDKCSETVNYPMSAW